MRMRRSSRRPSLTSATSRSGGHAVPSRELGRKKGARRVERQPRNPVIASAFLKTARPYVFFQEKAQPTSLNSWRVRKQLSRRVSDHIEERCAARSFRDSSKLRHGGQCIRPLHGVHHAAVPGRRRVTARAPDRGCVSRREKQSVSPRPVRRPRGARVTRAAKPRRFTRFRRVLRACGFLRSADRPPRYRPPRRSSRAREQDRRRREALPRDAFGRRALRHRHAHVVAEPVRRGRQAQKVFRD